MKANDAGQLLLVANQTFRASIMTVVVVEYLVAVVVGNEVGLLG